MSIRPIVRNPEGMDPKERAGSVRDGAQLAATVVLWILCALLVFVQLGFEPDDPLYLAQVSMRLHLGKLLTGVVDLFVGFALSLSISQWFENTKVGHRYGGPHVILAALVIAAGLVFAGAR